jgi:hypothetical protein
MYELLKSEIFRLKYWLVTGLISYLILTSTYLYFNIYNSSGLMIGNINSVFFGISSLLLGVFQFRRYKNINRWIYLINRPVSHWKLCLTLIAAASVIILIQFVAIDILVTLIMDFLGQQIIDQRHYLQSIYIFFIALAFYLCGVYIQLSPSKAGFLLFVFPCLIIISLLFGGQAILISIILSCWILYLVLHVFKANLNSHQTGFVTTIMSLIPIQLGLYFILIMGFSFAIQSKYMIIDGAGIERGWNEYFTDDVYTHVNYLDGNEQMKLSLQSTNSSSKSELYNQLEHIKTEVIAPQINYFANQNQLPYQQNIYQMKISDPRLGIDWVFSMDEMLFIHKASDKKIGIPTLNSKNSAFDSVPYVHFNGDKYQVITQHNLYEYNSTYQSLDHKFHVQSHESLLTGLIKSGSFLALISTENLYLFNRIESSQNLKQLTPQTSIKLPGSYLNLTRIELAELLDQTLIHFLFGNNSSKGRFPAEQILIKLSHANQQSNVVAQRPLKQGFSDLYYQMGWYLSPLGHLSYEYGIKPLLQSEPIEKTASIKPLSLSNNVKVIAIVLSLLSVLLTFYLSKNRVKSKLERGLWTLLSALTSVTGLLTFLILSDRVFTIQSITKNQ